MTKSACSRRIHAETRVALLCRQRWRTAPRLAGTWPVGQQEWTQQSTSAGRSPMETTTVHQQELKPGWPLCLGWQSLQHTSHRVETDTLSTTIARSNLVHSQRIVLSTIPLIHTNQKLTQMYKCRQNRLYTSSLLSG